MCNFPSGNFPKVRLGPLNRRRQGGRALRLGSAKGLSAEARTGLGAEHCGLDRIGKLPLGKLHIWKVVTWENTLGKLPLGKNPLGKYIPNIL